MNRRHFLSTSIAATGLGLIGAPEIWAATATPDAYQAAFTAALKDKPWLIGFESALGDRAVADVLIEGKIPGGFNGTFYRNGPARHDFAGQRYHHWFDGDGMVHRYHIANGKVDYRARFTQTEKFKAEQSAGKFLFDGGGTLFEKNGTGAGPDSINPANINILPVNNELWALWEGGSAHALDPVTLDVKSIVTFSDDLKGAPFSAHPRIGGDGRIWNIGSLGNKMILYRLNKIGSLEKFKVIDIDSIGTMHDFFLTERSMVIVLPSSDMEGTAESFFGRIRARPDKPMQVIIIDRESLEIKRRAELPSGYWFHGGNAWEEKNGTVHFDISILPSAKIIQDFRNYMRGDIQRDSGHKAIVNQVSISPTGKATMTAIAGDSEFPRIDPRFATRRNNFLYGVEKTSSQSHWFDGVRRMNLARGTIDRFTYGAEHLVEEHVFVPRHPDHRGSRTEGNGWLVGTTLHWPTRRTCFNILDAQHLSDGPIARAWLPMPAPLGFHGQFVQA
jgi:all-trans-8'-apo-beta-carotenal 15,15'-oxygenase